MSFLVDIPREVAEIFIAQGRNIAEAIFSPELDLITRLLTVYCIGSIWIELVYFAMPRPLKRKVEQIDLPNNQPGVSSYTGQIVVANLLGLAVVIAHKFSLTKSHD